MYVVAICISDISCRFSTGGSSTLNYRTSIGLFFNGFSRTPCAFQTLYGAWKVAVHDLYFIPIFLCPSNVWKRLPGAVRALFQY